MNEDNKYDLEEDEGHQETEELLQEIEEKVDKEYSTVYYVILAALAAYLLKFNKQDKEMKKKQDSGEITKKQYQEWRKEKIINTKKWADLRDNLSAKVHNANKAARSIINDFLPDAYAININYATYLIEHGLKVDTKYELYDRLTVERLVKKNPKLLPNYNTDIFTEKDLSYQKRRFQARITQSVLSGESIPELSKKIAEDLSVKNKAVTMRYARTAMTSAQNAGRLDGYKRAIEMGIKMRKTWVATLDGKTRHEHRILDGQTVEVDKPFRVEGEEIMYPADPNAAGHLVWNCRCTMIGQELEFEHDLSDLSLRYTEKMGDMAYDEWKAAKPVRDKPKKKKKKKKQ